jgi:putative ABC transport system permease protein
VRGPTYLALAWLRAHPGRSALVAGCVALILLLPLALAGFLGRYADDLTKRARSTPLVVGAPGSRFDLVLAALHFRGRTPQPVPWSELEKLAQDPELAVVPLHTAHTARGASVVGTTPDYARTRGLVAAHGTWPLRIGEVALGSGLAAKHGLGVGGSLLTDQGGILEFGLRQPLKLRVVGVLARTGTPDDDAAFVDVKTSWVLDGLGHSHVEPNAAPPSQVLGHDPEKGTVLAPSVVEAGEITPENAAEVHFHGPVGERPLTAILVEPQDERAAVIVRGRLKPSTSAQILDPTEVTEELLGVLFRIKAFFDANLLLVGTATGLLLALVVLLTLRVRARELATLARVGAARSTIVRIVATEWVVLLAAGVVAAWATSLVLARWLLPGLLP